MNQVESIIFDRCKPLVYDKLKTIEDIEVKEENIKEMRTVLHTCEKIIRDEYKDTDTGNLYPFRVFVVNVLRTDAQFKSVSRKWVELIKKVEDKVE